MGKTSQTAIPCLFMRGGTSKGPFFKEGDLPSQIAPRDKVLLSVMGSPDKRQIDGLGGAHPLTSKVGSCPKAPSRASISTSCSPNCSRTRTPSTPRPIAATCSPPSCRSRSRPEWSSRRGDRRRFRVLTLNTDMQCESPSKLEGQSNTRATPGSTARPELRRRSPSTSSTPRVRSAPGLLPTGHVRARQRRLRAFTLDLHRQRHAAGDVQGERRRPHRL